MRLNIQVARAAIILAQILGGAPMLQAAMAEGGRAQAGEPILVGESGPEVFVPSTPGTVVPQTYLDPAQAMPEISPRVDAWDRWLADLPESRNVEDWRAAADKAIDDERWRLSWDPTLVRPAKKPLKQFSPASESRTPGWLKAQEEAWIKAKASR